MLPALLEKAKALLSPAEQQQVVIFGSAAIVLHGIPFRDISDLDFFVSYETFETLKPRFSVREKTNNKGEKYHILIPSTNVPIEIMRDFPGIAFQDVFSHAETTQTSQGFRVASLDDVITWKTAQGRDKDLKDIEVVRSALGNRADP